MEDVMGVVRGAGLGLAGVASTAGGMILLDRVLEPGAVATASTFMLLGVLALVVLPAVTLCAERARRRDERAQHLRRDVAGHGPRRAEAEAAAPLVRAAAALAAETPAETGEQTAAGLVRRSEAERVMSDLSADLRDDLAAEWLGEADVADVVGGAVGGGAMLEAAPSGEMRRTLDAEVAGLCAVAGLVDAAWAVADEDRVVTDEPALGRGVADRAVRHGAGSGEGAERGPRRRASRVRAR